MERTKFSVKLITFLAGFHGVTAYALIFGVLLSCGLGVPLPEDITIISAGILAALHSIKFPGALLVCFLGVLAGDSFLFFMGRIYGYRIFRLPGFRSIFTESRIQIARNKVLRNSKFICFTGRFLPGLRAPIFLTAGIMGVHPFVFLILDGSAAMISVPVWVYVGWLFGSNLDQALAIALKTQKYFVGAVVLLFLVYIWFKMWAARRERKLLEESEKPPIPSEINSE